MTNAHCAQASNSSGDLADGDTGISVAEADRLAAEIEEARKQRTRPAEEPADAEPGSEVDALDE